MKSIILIFVFSILEILHAAQWSYEGSHGPAYWSNDYADCGESNQSPINIPSHCDTVYDEKLTPFVLSGFSDNTQNHTIKNNGHTVQVDVSGHMTVVGGGLSGTHKAAQFHFHWGPDNTKGSEHLLNGIQYPLELHVVTYNMKYPDIGSAVDKEDGLAVLGFMFEVGEINNVNYAPIISKLAQVRYKDNSTTISGYKVRHALPATYKDYYRYKGSLTTPPCYESVTWTVFKETIKLSSEQLSVFRSLFEDKIGDVAMTTNYRPVQRLNTRKVYTNHRDDSYETSTKRDTSAASKNVFYSGIILFALTMHI